MEKVDIKDALGSTGKRCFVNCFELAWEKNGILTNNDVLECDPEIKESGNGTKSALSTRRSNIRKIFENKRQLEALQICIGARIAREVREKAKELYDRYSRLIHHCAKSFNSEMTLFFLYFYQKINCATGNKWECLLIFRFIVRSRRLFFGFLLSVILLLLSYR